MTSVLVVNLKCVENIKGKADRVAKVTFRGLTYTSKVVQNAREAIYFGESFEWPLGRDIESDEMLSIEIFNYNKYLTNKMAAQFTILLQGVLEDGELNLCEPMVDANNRILETTITLDVRYFCPGSQPGNWDADEFQRPLPDIVYDDVEAEAIQIASKLNRTGEHDDIDAMSVGSGHSFGSGSFGGSSYHMDDETKSMVGRVFSGRSKEMDKYAAKQDGQFQEMHQAREFQVCVTIVEGQQLAGLNIDPVVRVQVGEDHKYTTIKQCTNSPYFNAYFVFDYFETPLILFDKMITLSVIDATGIPGRAMLKAANVVAGGVIGVFKCDVGTVYNAHDHQFYRKWAVLLDPKDIAEGAKGYLKVDIAVVTKGEQPKVVQKLNKADENNIEGNLLLPGNMPVDRQMAAYTVIIYNGQDLPRMDAGIMASMKKAITRSNAFVDAYVKVSFLGHVAKTSVKKSYNPDWKQKITFIEMFPPMTNRIKVQIYDQDALSDDCIATHFIELSQIMDPGGETEGMLPSYGPNWINFYGAPRNFKSAEDLEPLNDGIGDGAAYRGRVLISVKTELLDGEMSGPCSAHVDKIRTASKIEVAVRREHLLFATVFDASMIDKEYKDKAISFEITIGMAGNNLDKKLLKGGTGIFEPSSSEEDDEDEDSDDGNEKRKLIDKTAVKEEEVFPTNSSTPPTVPISDDKNYYYIPTGQNKPCLYVIGKFEDLRKRIYHANLLTRIAEQMDESMDVVRTYILDEKSYSHVALAKCMHDLCKNCDRYTRLSTSLSVGSGSGKTKLDKYRLATCKANIERIKINAKAIKTDIDKFNVKTKYKEARDMLKRLKHLSREPQHSLPDVFIWMIVDKKRVAYSRLPAGELLHATTAEFQGKYCGQVHNIFLKKPGIRASGPSGWAVQAKLMIYLWLGIRETSKSEISYLKGMPSGFDLEHPDMTKARSIPPSSIHYEEEHIFQLRAHMYQARSLVGSDDSGLSDPFARVIIYNQCKETLYIDETLSPTWDQTLVFDNIRIHGDIEAIQKKPPLVLIEVYDYDTIGDPEFLGRAMVTPKVKPDWEAHEEPHWPPKLEWIDVFRGPRRAGQLLATFELLQGDSSQFLPLPEKEKRKKGWVVPLPPVIKPALSKYRIEVMYWGVRELKRVQLLSVDRPRVEIECAGKVLKSSTIPNINKNCNFEVSPVNYLDVEMPDDEHYWPPITIRCYDCRSFGREVLVGVHTITNIQSYIWISEEEKLRKHAAKKALREEQKQIQAEKSKMKQPLLKVPNGSIAGSSVSLNRAQSPSMQSLGEDGRSMQYMFRSQAPSIVTQNHEVRSIISIKTTDDGISMRRMFASQAPSMISGMDDYSLPSSSSGSGESRPPTVIGRYADTTSIQAGDGTSIRNMFASRPASVVNGPNADSVSMMTMDDGKSLRVLFESSEPSRKDVNESDVVSVVNLDDGRSMRLLFEENPPIVQTLEGDILSMVMVDDGYSIRRMLASADVIPPAKESDRRSVVTLGDGTSLRLMFEAPPSDNVDGKSSSGDGISLRRLYGLDDDDAVSIAPSTTSTNRKSLTIADDPGLRHLFGSRQSLANSQISRSKGMSQSNKRSAEKGSSPRLKYKKQHKSKKHHKSSDPPARPNIPKIIVTSDSNPDIGRGPSMYSINESDVESHQGDGTSMNRIFSTPAQSVISEDSVSIATFGSKSGWDEESVVTAIEVDRISPIDSTDVVIVDGRKSILKSRSSSSSSPSRKSGLDVKSVSQYQGSSPTPPRPESRSSHVAIAMPDDVPLVAPDSPSRGPGSRAPSVAGDGTPLKESKITRKVTAPTLDEKERKKQKELMAELDWWSKYYASKRDLEKEDRDHSVDLLFSDDEFDIQGLNEEFQGLDFEGMDITRLREEIGSADELDDDDDKVKKKMRKKAKKKKLKLNKIKAKAAKKRLKNMKGVFNKAFKKDDGDIVSLAGSQQDFHEAEDPDKAFIERITFYEDDLENKAEFSGFSEWVHTYDLFRGKKLGDDDDDLTRLAGKFKGTLIIYKLEEEVGEKEKEEKRKPPELRLTKNLPPQKVINVTVRIYILQAMNLHPSDLNGKADPYLVIKLGKHKINDKDNKKLNNLNPVFGRLFEVDARFPMDSILRIQIVDYDKYSSDDLIGETVIDLENRLFSKHRATCGISNRYEIFGYNTWRDPIRPTQILEKLCKFVKIDPPKYESGKVTVGGEEFLGAKEIEDFQGNIRPTDEHAALEALKSFEEVPGGFPIVPEHVETRKLYDPEKPGVEQGRLEMWVDLFPSDQPAPSVTIDVTPRKPQVYELRVIIWNTDEVVLEDTNPLTGEASSDIFVRGFVHGRGEDDVQTDIHYRSMSGEGNFNWRFVFNFEYLKAEEKIVKKGGTSIFNNEADEERIPAHLTLQVWDADIVSADDFLGSLLLDMNKMPRPAKDAKNATLDLLKKDGTVPTLNLFKQKRVKGWWPFEGTDEQTKERSLVGKVEAEIHLLTTDEAEKSPAGLGREAPDPLSEPNRPDSSFLWFMNPLKTLKYIIWKNYKWLILKLLILLLIILFLVLFFYAFPGAMVDKMFGT